MITDTTNSTFAPLKPVPLGAAKWTSGFWKDRFDCCVESMLPNMWQIWQDKAVSHNYANFLIAAGLEEGDHHGPPFHDGDFYKWFEGVAFAYAITKDDGLKTLMDEIIDVIGAAQREDGYIHTPVIIAERSATGEEGFENRLNFETYNLGHLMTTGCIHYRATGETKLLEIARKSADFLHSFYTNAASELARNAICPSHYMGVIELYRTTGDKKYLELGQNLIAIRDLMEGGGDDNQDRIPFLEQDRALGHAVRANYLFAGVADVYAEVGGDEFLDALETLWHNVVETKMYVTGGCGALYDGASPDGTPHQEGITRTHQAYGREYQLPNATAYNETCANIGNVLWNWRMLNITGGAQYADVLELSLFNSVLSGISLDGVRYFYKNTLRQVDDLPFELRWPRTRAPYISSFCCPPNTVRTVAETVSYAYSQSAENLYLHLYGSSELETTLYGEPLHVIQTTRYPWDGEVNLRIVTAPKEAFSINLRVPSWAVGATVEVDGAVESAEPNTYHTVTRQWQAGDEVTLHLPMNVQILQSHPHVEESRGEVAIKRGPLVYCLEAIDLPEGVRPTDIVIPSDIQLEAVADDSFGELLPDAVKLRGTALVREESDGWDGKLYRPLQAPTFRPIDISLVPYFAWDNRGLAEMTVWMPVKWI